MKVTLAFDSIEESENLKIHINALSIYSAVFDIIQNLRNKLKHETLTEEEYSILNKFRDEMNIILEENTVLHLF